MKKILILGNDGYIGSHVENWLKKDETLEVDGLCIKNDAWKDKDFTGYDVIINAAGIAHIQPREELRSLFYSINTDLTIRLCEKSKLSGAGQFIFLSSMNVFGDHCRIVTNTDNPSPTSFYGDSKLKADQAIQKMNTDFFKVASVRPPAVYGKGCKGNFPTLVRYAARLPVFPDYEQKKSMIYIDNLCEFIRLLIEHESFGVFHPQNREYTSTTEMVREIARVQGHSIRFTKIFNPLLRLLEKRIRIINCAFADDAYELELSGYFNWEYCVMDFGATIKESIA